MVAGFVLPVVVLFVIVSLAVTFVGLPVIISPTWAKFPVAQEHLVATDRSNRAGVGRVSSTETHVAAGTFQFLKVLQRR